VPDFLNNHPIYQLTCRKDRSSASSIVWLFHSSEMF